MTYPEQVKSSLLEKVSEMSASPWLFAKNPEKDFSRKRMLDFENTMRLIISMEASSTKRELLKYFHYDTKTVSASAFNQQRNKLLPKAFEFLFQQFNASFPSEKNYQGYRLLACDGSDINFARNPNDADNYYEPGHSNKGFNLMHLNALYDLCSRRYVDALIQSGHGKNEYRAICDMIDRYPLQSNEKVIVIGDRGFHSYNVYAHAQEKGVNYLLRAKDRDRKGMVGHLSLPDTDEFDVSVNLILTRRHTKETKAHPEIYKSICSGVAFDYISPGSRDEYPLKIRVVRFAIKKGSYECIVTNLPADEFPLQVIKKLYQMRWGIETSFRELKYAVGMAGFHSKKPEYIKQEIWARMILYNFCELITTHVIIQQKDTKHVYQLNYTMAIYICHYFLQLKPNMSPPDVEALIKNNILPVRPGRNGPRKVKFRNPVSFLYRIV